MRSRTFFWVALAVCLSPAALSQKSTKPLTLDLSAYAGGTFDFPGAGAYSGLCLTNTSNCSQQFNLGKKSLPVFGGAAMVSVNRYIWLFGDFGYALADNQSSSASVNTSSIYTTVSRQYKFATGGIQPTFPTVHRVVPFLRVGGGEVFHSYSFAETGSNVSGLTSRNDSEWIPAISFGGGVHWYIREHQGVNFTVQGLYLSHGVEEVAVPTSPVGAAFFSRQSGGLVTVSYFCQAFGRGH